MSDSRGVKEGYRAIQRAWVLGESHSDIYTMIVDWIMMFDTTIQSRDELNDLFHRIEDGDELKEIVEDFIYGIRYVNMRTEFES